MQRFNFLIQKEKLISYSGYNIFIFLPTNLSHSKVVQVSAIAKKNVENCGVI